MCQDCLRAVLSLKPDATEQEIHDLLWSATAFPFAGPRIVYRQLRQAFRAGKWTVAGALKFAQQEFDREAEATRELRGKLG